ncbi:hypothetical protein PGT21_019949 [Puccinia graminis f. sp. tritici]|uniref:ATP-dependent DNA helicase sgs1 n=1 Tax=Puccinia graminis f. sp. tritici TaxID=56615 RepID=A0A5B0M6E0_PUCGR|nr:hypothetical protein PGT21_019949 [Puccinia graminis f. sp. tritici]KAA1125851.1 hypothetical protein PGTUg99_008549 [Puccinia graminis f. sp. tritici]
MPARRRNKKKKARCVRINRITLSENVLKMDEKKLREHIAKEAESFYKGQTPKPLQLDAVMNLTELKHTFVMAGTGFGKSRIAEMYFNLFTAKDGVVLHPGTNWSPAGRRPWRHCSPPGQGRHGDMCWSMPLMAPRGLALKSRAGCSQHANGGASSGPPSRIGLGTCVALKKRLLIRGLNLH